MSRAAAPRDPFRIGSRPMVIGRIVTATITLVCVLIVYDGWSNLRLVDAIAIVIGPILAVFISHVFAASLVLHVELGRRPTGPEWLDAVGFETRFLLLAVPPVAILVILSLTTVSLSQSVHVVIWVEALSLGLWAGLAAYYAGLRGRPLALAVLAGLVVSALVLTLQVVLQPGKAAQDGAAGRDGFATAYLQRTLD